jgi:hypothetical protein
MSRTDREQHLNALRGIAILVTSEEEVGTIGQWIVDRGLW